MRIAEAIDRFLEHRRLKRRAPSTIARYATALAQWQRWRNARGAADDLAAVTIEELRAYLRYLLDDHIPHTGNPRRPSAAQRGMAPASVASTRCILRAFWTFLAHEDLLAPHQVGFFQGDRIPAPEVELQDRAAWDETTVAALLAACAGRPAEEIARNRAIVLLIYESGVRLDELCRLQDADCDFADRSARIVGKGRKKRWIFWHDRTAVALAHYLSLRRGPSGGPLFRGTSWRNDGGALTRDAVRAVIKRLACRAGIALPVQAPVHSGRHGFAHAMIDGGMRISRLARLMGHADIRTTMRYLHERKEKLQQAHRQAHEAHSERRQRAQGWMRAVGDDS